MYFDTVSHVFLVLTKCIFSVILHMYVVECGDAGTYCLQCVLFRLKFSSVPSRMPILSQSTHITFMLIQEALTIGRDLECKAL
jgi:hypothetical protein